MHKIGLLEWQKKFVSKLSSLIYFYTIDRKDFASPNENIGNNTYVIYSLAFKYLFEFLKLSKRAFTDLLWSYTISFSNFEYK